MTQSELNTPETEAFAPDEIVVSMTLFHVLAEKLREKIPSDLSRIDVLVGLAFVITRLKYQDVAQTDAGEFMRLIACIVVMVNALPLIHPERQLRDISRLILFLLTMALTTMQY